MLDEFDYFDDMAVCYLFLTLVDSCDYPQALDVGAHSLQVVVRHYLLCPVDGYQGVLPLDSYLGCSDCGVFLLSFPLFSHCVMMINLPLVQIQLTDSPV